jgi:uncharacterized protein (TIGR02246 family)
MNSRRATIIVAAIAYLAFAGPSVRAQNGSAADEAAIKQTVAMYTEGFNAHDPHAIASLFAEDADFTNLRGASRKGRADIQANFEALFKGALRAATRTDSVRNVRFFTPNLAQVDTDVTIAGARAPNGAENPLRKGLMSLIMNKQGGQWKILVFHELDYPEPAAPAAK